MSLTAVGRWLDNAAFTCCSAVAYDENKKQKKENASPAKEDTITNRQSWEWQNIAENLQLAHQELLVIIDLIETVKYLLFANLNILMFNLRWLFLVLISWASYGLCIIWIYG